MFSKFHSILQSVNISTEMETERNRLGVTVSATVNPAQVCSGIPRMMDDVLLGFDAFRKVLYPSLGLMLRQYVSPKHWFLPASLHGVKAQNMTFSHCVCWFLD